MILTINLTVSLMSDYKVNLVEDNLQEFNVKFQGPKDSKYG